MIFNNIPPFWEGYLLKLSGQDTFLMNSNVVGKLQPYYDDPPDELVSHFATPPLLHAPDLFINLLNLDDSLAYTDGIQHTFISKSLGLFVLDDANNSNPFCYVTRGPARGLILQLKHDDASAFAFSSLSSFLGAIADAIETRKTIDSLVFDTCLLYTSPSPRD